jgi:hypothetical protein
MALGCDPPYDSRLPPPRVLWEEAATVKARLVAFGELEIEGEWFAHHVVIDAGRIRRRDKAPSRAFRDAYGHTPLSAAEAIPWGGRRLIVGTGADGSLPIAPDVRAEAERRGIRIDAVPTREACRLLENLKPARVRAILHVTC